MRDRWEHLKIALRIMFSTTQDHDDDPPNLEADAAARTEWVRSHGPITRPEDSA